MKKIFVVAAFAVSMIAVNANAGEGPAWLCKLEFQGKAEGIQAVFGDFSVTGAGDLNCVSPLGETRAIPVKINMGGEPVALRLAFGSFDVYGASAGITLFTGEPADLLGHYLVGNAQGAIVAGAGVVTGVHVGVPDISVELSLQFVRGFGLNVGITDMELSLDEARL